MEKQQMIENLLHELKQLLEDAKADKELNDQSKIYFDKLVKLIASDKYIQTLKKLKPNFLSFYMTDIDKTYNNGKLKINLYSTENKESKNNVSSGGTYDRTDNVISIYHLNFDYKTGQITDFNTDNKRSIFQHEFAHMSDQQRYQDPQYLDKQQNVNVNQFKGGGSDYYNSNWEKQAFLQGYLYKIINLAIGLPSIDYPKFLTIIKKDSQINNLFNQLNPDNQKKLIKRIYGIYDYVKDNSNVFEFIKAIEQPDDILKNYMYNYFLTQENITNFSKNIYNKLVSNKDADSEFVNYAKNNLNSFIRLQKLIKKEIKSIGGDTLIFCKLFFNLINNIVTKYETGKIPDDSTTTYSSLSRYIGNDTDVANSLNKNDKNILVFLLSYNKPISVIQYLTDISDCITLITTNSDNKLITNLINKLKNTYNIIYKNGMNRMDLDRKHDLDMSAYAMAQDGVLIVSGKNDTTEKPMYILTDKGKKIAKIIKTSGSYDINYV